MNFEGKLSGVKAGNAYTLDELRRFLRAIQTHNLDIIPLVQTVGHLEYILKYPNFSKYREEERYPQVRLTASVCWNFCILLRKF